MDQLTKQKYVTPTLKQHGIVRELTQTGSGGFPHRDKDKHKGRKKKKWFKRWW
jgi:hypothetical protein